MVKKNRSQRETERRRLIRGRGSLLEARPLLGVELGLRRLLSE
jgi:hypothetical protein